MATYISLIKMTQQGAQTFREIPHRVDMFREVLKGMGAEITSWHLTLGRYDIVATVQAPDDETAAKVGLMLGSMGNAKTETLRAFSLDETKHLIASVPSPKG